MYPNNRSYRNTPDRQMGTFFFLCFFFFYIFYLAQLRIV